MTTKTTITISVNIATGNKNEGNAEFQITIDESKLDAFLSDLRSLNMAADLVDIATKNYNERNS